MNYCNGNNPETTRPHRKTPPFHIEGILGLDKASRVDGTTIPSSPTQIAVPVEDPATYPRRAIRRRPRTVYTAQQMEGLETTFAANQYPDIYQRDALADALDMTEARLQVWFQNRRARLRRQAKRNASSSSPSDDTLSSVPRSVSPSSQSNLSPSSDRYPSQVSSPSLTPNVYPLNSLSSSPAFNEFSGYSSVNIPERTPTMPAHPASRCTDVCCSPPPIGSQVCCSPSCSPDSPPSTASQSVCSAPTSPQYCYPDSVYPSSNFLNYQGLSAHTRQGEAFYYPYYPHQFAAYHPGAGAHTSLSFVPRTPIFSHPLLEQNQYIR